MKFPAIQIRRTALGLLVTALACCPPLQAQILWTPHDSGSLESLGGISQQPGQFVTVGEAGMILTSSDGQSWAPVASGTDRSLRGIVRTAAQFVVVGQGGTILTSPDGTDWSPQVSGITQFISGIACGAGRLVAVGGSGKIVTSTDGSLWEPANSPTTRFLQAVAFADGRFVAVGASGTIVTSADGLAWSLLPTGQLGFLSAVNHFAGSWFVAGQNGLMLASDDTLTWQVRTTNSNAWIRAFASDGERLLAVGDEGSILQSFDGVIWQRLDSGATAVLTAATFANGQFIAVGEPFALRPGNPAHALILTSPQASAVRWERPEISVREDAGALIIQLFRSAPAADPAEFALAAFGASAKPGIDFDLPAARVAFAAGSNEATVIIPLSNNPEIEPPEQFELALELLPGDHLHQLVPPAALRVTIIDAQDSDHDGLPDEWEITYFGSVDAFTANDDPDGDHNDNARELAEATNPADSRSARYRLGLSVAAGSGTVAASPSATSYFAGESVALSAVPGAGTFAGWSGDAASQGSPLTVTMDRDQTIAANFTLSYAEALDTAEGVFDWATFRTGQALWLGLRGDAWDGIDATTVKGGDPGDIAGLFAAVWGPAQLGFYWKSEPATGTSLSFSLDNLKQPLTPASSSWTWRSVTIPPGLHGVSWNYVKTPQAAASPAGLAGLDRITLDVTYSIWAAAMFTAEELADPEISAPAADADHEGLPNLFEYLLDTDPKKASWSSYQAPRFAWIAIDGVATPALTYRLVRSRLGNLTVVARASNDLTPGSWEALGGGELLNFDGLHETRRILDPGAATGTPRRYFQFQVLEPSQE